MKNKLKSWTAIRRHFSSLTFCNVICCHSSIDENTKLFVASRLWLTLKLK